MTIPERTSAACMSSMIHDSYRILRGAVDVITSGSLGQGLILTLLTQSLPAQRFLRDMAESWAPITLHYLGTHLFSTMVDHFRQFKNLVLFLPNPAENFEVKTSPPIKSKFLSKPP